VLPEAVSGDFWCDRFETVFFKPSHHRHWFRTLFQLKDSVIPGILHRTLVCAAFGRLVSLMYAVGMPVSVSILGSVVPSIGLGLLLVFRTNTAYERFWEGRKLWGT